MGCSASRNLTVDTLDGTGVVATSKSLKTACEKRETGNNIPDIVGVDPPSELIESGAISNVHKTQHGMSFEIPFEEEESESIIRKHPPKRFQKLEDQQNSPSETLNKLQEKLDEAEIRRQQILQQRIQSAKYRHNLKKQSSITSLPEDEQGNLLKVPGEFHTKNDAFVNPVA